MVIRSILYLVKLLMYVIQIKCPVFIFGIKQMFNINGDGIQGSDSFMNGCHQYLLLRHPETEVGQQVDPALSVRQDQDVLSEHMPGFVITANVL